MMHRAPFNIKIPSFRYGDFHCRVKTVVSPSFLTMGIAIWRKDGLYIERGPWRSSAFQQFCKCGNHLLVYKICSGQKFGGNKIEIKKNEAYLSPGHKTFCTNKEIIFCLYA